MVRQGALALRLPLLKCVLVSLHLSAMQLVNVWESVFVSFIDLG